MLDLLCSTVLYVLGVVLVVGGVVRKAGHSGTVLGKQQHLQYKLYLQEEGKPGLGVGVGGVGGACAEWKTRKQENKERGACGRERAFSLLVLVLLVMTRSPAAILSLFPNFHFFRPRSLSLSLLSVY